MADTTDVICQSGTQEGIPFPDSEEYQIILQGGGGGAPVVTYLNRWWDSVAVAMVRYTTTGAPDPTGASYPGPGVPGVTATSYCLEGSW